MANFAYTKAKADLMKGTLDLCGAGADVRVALVMTNTTFDTEQDLATIGAASTPDFFDGACYAAGGNALTGETVNTDCANNRAEFDACDLTFTTLGAGTRNIQAMVIYKFCTNLCCSIPLYFVDSGFGCCGTPANGGNIVISWNAQGIAQVT